MSLQNHARHAWRSIVRLSLIATAALIALHGNPAFAATNCDGGITISANTSLATDYEQTVSGTPCITLTGGADLNMNGHRITCKGSYIGSCNIAISATSTGSTVNNSVPGSIAINADPGTGWGTGVLNAQIVDDLRIDQAFLGIATDYATRISGNVVTHAAQCIEATLANNTSTIQHNLCSTNMEDPPGDPATIGIAGTGTTSGSGPHIQRNMVTHANFGIYANNRMRIEDNINCDEVPYFGFGVGIVVDAGQTQTGSNNLCCDAPEASTNDGCTLPHEMSGNFRLWP